MEISRGRVEVVGIPGGGGGGFKNIKKKNGL